MFMELCSITISKYVIKKLKKNGITNKILLSFVVNLQNCCVQLPMSHFIGGIGSSNDTSNDLFLNDMYSYVHNLMI